MVVELLKFELKYHFKQISFLVAAFLFFFLGCFAAAKGGFGGNEIHRNAPYVITNIVALFSLFTIFSGTLFSANVVLRDSIYKLDSIIFTTAITRSAYFLIRFLGLFTAVFSLLVIAVLGIYLGTNLVSHSELGAYKWSYFLQPLLVFGIPNALFATSFIFCTAMLTQNVRAIYTTGVLLYILYMVASVFGNSPLLATSEKISDPSMLPFLMDPFGLASFFYETRIWTDLQRNQQLFKVEGVFLLNRLIWFFCSSSIIAISYLFFNFRLIGQKQAKQKKQSNKHLKAVPFRNFEVSPNGFRYHFSAFASQFKLEIASLFKHIPFMVMLLLWAFYFAMELKDSLKGPYGLDFYPTTGLMIEEMRSLKLALILIIFYAAELVGREKTTNFQALIYSTPVRNATLYAAKCLTLFVLVIILVTLNIGIGIALQLVNDFAIEPLNYLSLYYYSAFPIFLFIILILFIQNLTTNKYLGMLLSMIVIFFVLFASRLGISHYLLRFASTPDLQFSYFNGFGKYGDAFNYYMLYWTGFAGILVIFTIAIWQNAMQATFFDRLKSIPKVAFKLKFGFLASVVLMLGSGSYIFYQTNVLGNYETSSDKLKWQIGYEKKYKPLDKLPQPTIKSVKTEVDLFPNKEKYSVKGSYQLKNESNEPISKIWVDFDPTVSHFKAEVEELKESVLDEQYHQQFITLSTPLQPGENLTMKFSFEVIRSGFMPFDSENSLVSNGSYIELEKFVPQFGFNENKMLNDPFARRKNGLSTLIFVDSPDRNPHLIDYETIISVPLIQKAITVGVLQKEWTNKERRFFCYKTDAPINFMFALSAANYQVKKENYQGIELQVNYLPGHNYNVKTMFEAIKDAIAYGSSNFHPYSNRTFTLAEIPQYRGAATAYPGVVFSAERVNFLGNYAGKDKIDQSYSITAHEVAHQWWANQLNPNRGPGYAMLTESLAKYTEYMLMEKKYGKLFLRNYLKADQNIYFLEHQSNDKELPLSKTVDQNYVHYQKGGLTFYAIKEMIGEKTLNQVLSGLIKTYTYPNLKIRPMDLVAALDQAVPENQKALINESFNAIVTHQMEIKVLSCKAIGKGQYSINLTVKVEKYKQGEKNKLLPDLDLDLAFFSTKEGQWEQSTKPFLIKKYHFNQFETKLTLIVNQKPKVVAIDPYAYILDENLADNLAEIN